VHASCSRQQSGLCLEWDRVLWKGSKETDPLDADSIYGASKIAGEHLIKAFQLETGMHAWRFRFAGLLGPRYTHGHVADFVHALQQHPDHLTVLGDGRQNKAYLDVRDCVRGMLDIVDDGFDGASISPADSS